MAGASDKGRRQLAWHLRTSARLERSIRAKLRKELYRRYRAAAAGYKRDRIVGAEMALRGHEEAVREIVRANAVQAVYLFGPAVLDSLKGAGAYMAKDYQEDYYEQLVREWLESDVALSRITFIAATTRLQVRNIISQGITEGLGVDAIARNMRRRFSNLFAGVRAHVIARTETHNAASFAIDAAARASGIQELQREWVAVEDERTRDEHADTSGTKVGMDEPFEFNPPGGDTYYLMRPGDPSGPPEGTIMCRCAVVFHTPG